jgi:hypothetical protein
VASVTKAVFPGGYTYFRADTPSLLPSSKPLVLATHSDSNTRLSKLEFDDLERLSSISYLGKDAVAFENLASIVGLPASYFNRILFRYASQQIPDLLRFLDEPWATCLFHESLPLLRQAQAAELAAWKKNPEVQQLITKLVNARAPALITAQRQKEGKTSKENFNLDPALVAQLTARAPIEFKKHIQRSLINFLKRHEQHLPGYKMSL